MIRFKNYFGENVRCILLDRDHKDMFILSKYVWSRSSGWNIFSDSAEKFCTFYSRLLNTEKRYEDGRILRMHFEDLVYNYDSSIACIQEFIRKDNLVAHISKKKLQSWNFNKEYTILIHGGAKYAC